VGHIVNKIAIYLNRHLSGNVFDKDAILESYATDRSPLKIKPRFVALPESTADVRKLVRFVNQLAEKKYDLPISVRGAGLSKTGADLSSGLVLSMEKMDRVRELDAHDRLVHVQAGISLEKLNAVLAPHGLTIPISADPRTTVGSLISEAPVDKFSKKYGGIMNYVDRIETVLASGDILQTARLSRHKLSVKKTGKGLEGDIYEKLDKVLVDRAEFLKTVPDSSRLGYPGLKHIRRLNGKVFDLLPAFFGAEGSLGIITEVILRAEPLPPRPHRLFAVFSTFKAAEEFANYTLKLSPLSVELFDMRIFKTSDKFGKKPDLLTRKLEDGYLVLGWEMEDGTMIDDMDWISNEEDHHIQISHCFFNPGISGNVGKFNLTAAEGVEFRRSYGVMGDNTRFSTPASEANKLVIDADITSTVKGTVTIATIPASFAPSSDQYGISTLIGSKGETIAVPVQVAPSGSVTFQCPSKFKPVRIVLEMEYVQ